MELKTFFIEPTARTPQIDLNPFTGELIISGRSIPENAAKVFDNTLHWVSQYVTRPKQTTNLRLHLEYFNTPSSIWLGKIVKILCSIKEPENTVMIHLYFNIEEFDSMGIEDIRENLSPVIDMIGNPAISVGIRIYATDDAGGILKESMVLL